MVEGKRKDNKRAGSPLSEQRRIKTNEMLWVSERPVPYGRKGNMSKRWTSELMTVKAVRSGRRVQS